MGMQARFFMLGNVSVARACSRSVGQERICHSNQAVRPSPEAVADNHGTVVTKVSDLRTCDNKHSGPMRRHGKTRNITSTHQNFIDIVIARNNAYPNA